MQNQSQILKDTHARRILVAIGQGIGLVRISNAGTSKWVMPFRFPVSAVSALVCRVRFSPTLRLPFNYKTLRPCLIPHNKSSLYECRHYTAGKVNDVIARNVANTVHLRPYQEECLVAIQEALDRGVGRVGVSLPTGSGKTTIFGELLERIRPPSQTRRRVLILVSSVQLATQTAQYISKRFPGLWVEIEQGQKFRACGYADVTVATWQTLISKERNTEHGLEQLRLEKFDPACFKVVIVDEAHHAASQSWRLILNHFDPRVRVEGEEQIQSTKSPSGHGPHPPIIGFSATFSRHDGLSLGSVFEEIVFHKDVLDLIDEEWLSPLRFTSIQASIPLDSVKISGGNSGADFSTASLASAINTPPINTLIVRTWLSRTQGDTGPGSSSPHVAHRSRTLVFAVNIQHVYDLTAEFCKAGIDARALVGSTSAHERRALLEAFANGEFPVLVNCAVLTEGADIPSIDCVLLARPTLSRNLFSQMIGRGMRLSPQTGKKDCLILDLVGSCSKGLVCAPTLFGLDPLEPLNETTLEELRDRSNDDQACQQDPEWMQPHLPQSPTHLRFIDWESAKSLHEAMKAKSLFTSSIEPYTSNAWIDCGDDTYVIDVPPNRGFAKVERQLDSSLQGSWVVHFTPRNMDGDEARAANPFHSRGFRSASPYRRPRKVLSAETLEQAIHGADTYIAKHILRNSGLMRSLLSRHAQWRQTPASSRQRAFVEKRLGLRADSSELSRIANMTKGEASIILTRMTHGAKARWQREAKRQNKLIEKEQKIEQRRRKETVAVGKLG